MRETKQKTNKKGIKRYLELYTTFLLYSFSSVLSKIASSKAVGSIAFWLLYGGTILILVVYAVCWQQVLKVFKLSFAYANKAILIIMGMIWGRLFFNESITLQKIIGAIIVSVGVWVMVKNE